ncbi:probable serine/threonine-protein kinase DDB_G0272254 [Daktulosphaira vitifoliae]|uniref:probable serine/threonine-protein kinase DDB_G0272254 n=1 Tax=Daktulosphaira vitifoliae TaxID=58002 RepID=UPI0021A99F51|nr:probable serine/threonine-protein kinase DDB_G0272254 [Daktulosphaira vitifoliae]XP_050547129.1 probable serine/threonine-protein kinase DDB_G0272254 [Daktulosphaira vitifoliae]
MSSKRKSPPSKLLESTNPETNKTEQLHYPENHCDDMETVTDRNCGSPVVASSPPSVAQPIGHSSGTSSPPSSDCSDTSNNGRYAINSSSPRSQSNKRQRTESPCGNSAVDGKSPYSYGGRQQAGSAGSSPPHQPQQQLPQSHLASFLSLNHNAFYETAAAAAVAYERAFLAAGQHGPPPFHLLDGSQTAAGGAGSPYFDIEQRLRKGDESVAEKLAAAHLMHLNNNTFMHNQNNNNNNNVMSLAGPAAKRTMDDVLKKLSSKMHIRDEQQSPNSPSKTNNHSKSDPDHGEDVAGQPGLDLLQHLQGDTSTIVEKERKLSEMILQLQLFREQLLTQQDHPNKVNTKLFY